MKTKRAKGLLLPAIPSPLAPGSDTKEPLPSLVQAGVPGVCAYNMGIPGFGLDQIWLTVRTQALSLHPRLVIELVS